MNWKNLKELLPENGQVVLICLDGIYRVAKYNHFKGLFEEKGTNHTFLINKKNRGPIYWMEVNPMEEERRQAS